MWETILTTVLVSVATAVLGVVGKAITDWSSREKAKADQNAKLGAQDEAILAIQAGVAKAQQQIVDAAKTMAADGKITKDELTQELKNAEKLAKQTAIEIATGPAAEYIASLTANAVGGLIDLVLQRNKAAK